MTLQFFLEILAFVIPLTHGIGMLFAAHAILYTRTSQGAIAWAFSLIFVPYVTIPLYLVFGRKKFHGYVEAQRKGNRHIDQLADALLAEQQKHRADLTAQHHRLAVFESLTMLPFTTGNAARLLIDGTETFDAIFAAMEKAKSYLLVQFFIIRDDPLGRRLQQCLIEKAKQGLRVYLLYDEIGSMGLHGRYLAPLRQAGVHVERFHTARGLRNRFQINFRNHRKVVIADGAIAFVGGHNVGVEYLGQSKRFGHWRDTHVAVTGPLVPSIQWSFIEDWQWATGEVLELPAPEATGDAPIVQADPTESAIVIPTSPADDVQTCTLMFLAAISTARHRFWVASPYFVPDETVYDALQLAALRGVDVRIMLPSKPDHIFVYLSAFSYLSSAEAVGVKFYRYKGGFLHQKVMLIDDDLAAVGTANLDNRSMRLNFEMTLLFFGKVFAAKVAQMLETDFLNCERATPGDFGRRGIPFRVAVRIARLLSPVL